MSDVQMRCNGAKAMVIAPYNVEFVAGARRLGGRWQEPYWVFDGRDEQRVRDLLIDCYGTDGTHTKTETLRVCFGDHLWRQAPATFMGRLVAEAKGRDTGATLGPGVILLEGSFHSGGSVKNWATITRGAVVLLRDVPDLMAQRALNAPLPEGVISVVIEDETPQFDKDALLAERKRLMQRVGEIDRILGEST